MTRWKQDNKYHARKKKSADGQVFDSRKEARRWQELLLMQRAGLINGLERQVKYVLIPAQREPATTGPRGGVKPGRVIEKEIAYIADFVYTEAATGRQVVEDVKGYKGGSAYAVFAMKRKLMLWTQGIRVEEV